MSTQRARHRHRDSKSPYSPAMREAFDKLVHTDESNGHHEWTGPVEDGIPTFEWEGQKYKAILLAYCLDQDIPYDEEIANAHVIHHQGQPRPLLEIAGMYALFQDIVSACPDNEKESMLAVQFGTILETLDWVLGNEDPDNIVSHWAAKVAKLLNDKPNPFARIQ